MHLKELLESWGPLLGHKGGWVFPLAFAAGVLGTAVCPCTLPAGMGLAGFSSLGPRKEGVSEKKGHAYAFRFFGGMVVSLILLGAAAGEAGQWGIRFGGKWWSLFMALFSFGFAIVFLSQLLRERVSLFRFSVGNKGPEFYGLLFSLGTPAVHLGLLLTMTAAWGRPFFGSFVALFFAVGRAGPFLVFGFLPGVLRSFFSSGKGSRIMETVSIGLLMMTGTFFVVRFWNAVS